MKKFFLIAAMILCVNFIAKAQSAHLGLKAGLNVSGINVSEGTEFDSKAGFYLGGLAHIHITKHFALQPELIYSMQGAERGTLTRSLNYINMPVLAQYMVGNGFRLQTGPQLGFMVSDKDKVGDVEVKINDQLNTTDLSWAFGASYVSKMGLGVDGRYNLGLTDMNELESSAKAKNSVFQLGAFYQFNH